jgi:ABC-type transporter Mla maintaining outer membrane lipid asymmetry ATPase subunit MlaF
MIELIGVKKSFGNNHVLRGVDLKVERGTSMVIIGGSGTGKSITIKSVLGLVKPDAGDITVDGQDVTKSDRDAFLARFGMLFQGGALFDSIPVWLTNTDWTARAEISIVSQTLENHTLKGSFRVDYIYQGDEQQTLIQFKTTSLLVYATTQHLLRTGRWKSQG